MQPDVVDCYYLKQFIDISACLSSKYKFMKGLHNPDFKDIGLENYNFWQKLNSFLDKYLGEGSKRNAKIL